MSASLTNSFWYLSLSQEAKAFHKATDQAYKTQEALLLKTLKDNQETAFGKKHDFAKLKSIKDYQQALPLSTYETFQTYVKQIAHGEKNVLSSSPVKLLEPTSGSTSGSKLIPYTKALQQAFRRGIAPWVVDLFQNDPQLLQGKAYWSISPIAQQQQRSQAGIPIGFEDDSAYLGVLGQWLRYSVMAMPKEIKFIQDIDAFRYLSLLFLLRTPSLRLISVWSPSFLLLLLQNLRPWAEALLNDIAKGQLSISMPQMVERQLQLLNTPRPKLAQRLSEGIKLYKDDADLYAYIWPKLRLISCWTAANAFPYAQELQSLFPHTFMQGKGLLATEGFVSFPLTFLETPILAIRSHVYEFLAEDGTVHLCNDLNVGQTYALVLTTDVFYRYQLFDKVEVTGFHKDCPLLRFVGKVALVSDHFGEKLHEHYVRKLLTKNLKRFNLSAHFAMLSCESYDNQAAYTLFYEGELKTYEQRHLAQTLDNQLKNNMHYAYCRNLGQLGPLRIIKIDKGLERYMMRARALGQKEGDVKPTSLSPRSGWLDIFTQDLSSQKL